MYLREPNSGLISLTYIIYGLHFFSALNGVLSSAFVLTAFLTGWPSIIGIILSYVKRRDAVDTYLESHFNWLIRTFWFALMWLLLSIIIAMTIFGVPIALLMLVFTGLWVIYRIVRGVIRLLDARPMPMAVMNDVH